MTLIFLIINISIDIYSGEVCDIFFYRYTRYFRQACLPHSITQDIFVSIALKNYLSAAAVIEGNVRNRREAGTGSEQFMGKIE